MSYKLVLTCDACGCATTREIDIDHPCESTFNTDNTPGWFFDDDNNACYCPEHAHEAAMELGYE